MLTSGQKRHLKGFFNCLLFVTQNNHPLPVTQMPSLQNDEDIIMQKNILVFIYNTTFQLMNQVEEAIKNGHFTSISISREIPPKICGEAVIVVLPDLQQSSDPSFLIDRIGIKSWDDICVVCPHIIEVQLLTHLVEQTKNERYLEAFPDKRIIVDIPKIHKYKHSFAKYIGIFFGRYFLDDPFPQFIIAGPYKHLQGTKSENSDVHTGFIGYLKTENDNDKHNREWEIAGLFQQGVWNQKAQSYYTNFTKDDQNLFQQDRLRYWGEVLQSKINASNESVLSDASLQNTTDSNSDNTSM